MKAIALNRQWLIFGPLLVAAAVITQQGKNHNPAPSASIGEIVAMVDAGALVVDVRERSVSAGSHLPGALLIPVEVVAAHLGKMEIAEVGIEGWRAAGMPTAKS